MENIGYVVYNTLVKGYLGHDMYFTEKIISAKINTDQAKCKTDIALLSRLYKDVVTFDEVNMTILPVSVTLQETT